MTTPLSQHQREAGQLSERLALLSSWLRQNNRSDWSAAFRESLSEAEFSLGLAGSLGSGKSSLLNALIEPFVNGFNAPEGRLQGSVTPLEVVFTDNMEATIELLKLDESTQDVPIHEIDAKHWLVKSIIEQDQLGDWLESTQPAPDSKANKGSDEEQAQSAPDQPLVGDNLLPTYRWIRIRLPSTALQGLSIIDSPATDGLCTSDLATVDVLSRIHALILVVDAQTGLRRTAATIRSKLPEARNKLPTLVAANTHGLDLGQEHREQLIEQLDTWVSASGTLVFDVKNRESAESRKLYDLCLNQLPTKRLQRLQQLTNDIDRLQQKQFERLDSTLSELNHKKRIWQSTQEEMQQQADQLSQKLAKSKEKLKSLEALYTRHERDINQSLDYITQTLSTEQLDAYQHRASHFLNTEPLSREMLGKAKNVMLSGLRLDVRRAEPELFRLQNTMRGLYDDLKMDFVDKPTGFDNFKQDLLKFEQSPIEDPQQSENPVHQMIEKPLYLMIKQFNQALRAWHYSAISVVNQLLKEQRQKVFEDRKGASDRETQMDERNQKMIEINSELVRLEQSRRELLKIS